MYTIKLNPKDLTLKLEMLKLLEETWRYNQVLGLGRNFWNTILVSKETVSGLSKWDSMKFSSFNTAKESMSRKSSSNWDEEKTSGGVNVLKI